MFKWDALWPGERLWVLVLAATTTVLVWLELASFDGGPGFFVLWLAGWAGICLVTHEETRERRALRAHKREMRAIDGQLKFERKQERIRARRGRRAERRRSWRR